MKVLVVATEPVSADRFTRPSSEQRYGEGIDADALQRQFGLPVQQAQ